MTSPGGGAVRSAVVRLRAEVGEYIAGMGRAAVATRGLTTEMNAAAKRGNLDAVASTATMAGLALAGAFTLVVGAAARFDQQMSKVDSVTDANAATMDRLREAAIKAGESTQYSATEAGQAIEELAKAGISAGDILGGALNGALALAAAGSLDLAEAADIAAKAMTIFNLEGSDVGHVADVLAAAANKSATDVHGLGMSLKQGGLAARAAGLGLEETVGVLAMFSDNALTGSDAGTSLKSALLMLQAPSGVAAAKMKEIGLRVYDANGAFIGMEGLAGQLQATLGHLTQEQRNSALAVIFGADAMRAANVLFDEGAAGVREYVGAVDEQGAAAKTAAEKTDNLMGDIERLTGALETLFIQSGSGASEGLRTLVQALSGLINQFGQLPGPIQSGIVMMAGLGGAALLLGGAFLKIRASTGQMMTELGDMGPRGKKAAAGLHTVGVGAQRAAIGLAAINAASMAFGGMLNAKVEGLVKSLGTFATTGQVTGEATRLFGEDLEKLDQALYDVANTGAWSSFIRGAGGMVEGMTGIGATYDKSLAHSRERIEALDSALAQMVSSGNAEGARQAFLKVAESAAEQGVSVAELEKVLPGYATAVETAAGASGGAASGLDDMSQAAAATQQNVKALTDAFDELFDRQMSMDEASLAFQEGLLDLNEELRSGAKTIKANTEEGQANRRAVLDQLSAIRDLRQARLDHGETLDEANEKYQTDVEGLRASMRAAGFTAAEVDALTAAYLAIPEEASTAVSAPGATKAEGQARDYNFAIGQIPRSKTTTITLAGYGEAIARADAIQRAVNRITGKNIRIGVQGGRGGVMERWGGAYEHGPGGTRVVHAATGLLRDPQLHAGQSPPLYGFAESGTGGEAFVPKFGEYNKAIRTLEVAAGWYGRRLTGPGGAGGGGGRTVINATLPITLDGQTIVKRVRLEVDSAMGQLADAMVYGTGG